MYKYINILSISIFMMSLYVLYGSFSANRSKKNIMSMMMLIIMISYKFIYFINIDNPLEVINLEYDCKIMIILFVIQLFLKEKQCKKTKLLIYMNYLLGTYSFILVMIKGENIYSKLITIYMLMTTLYLFSIILYSSKNKSKYEIIQIAYFAYILIGLIIGDSIHLMYIGDTLDFLSSIYIFSIILNINITEVYTKKVDVTSKLNRSNITMKIHDEKLNLNKNISKMISDNLKKKQGILDLILDQSNRCVLLIDDEGYILNEDDSFSKMWKEYRDCKYKINIRTFLNESIKNQNEFLHNINQVNETHKELNGEIEGNDGRFFNCTYAPFSIKDRNVGVICIITDITYKKNSERKIKDNDTKYKKIVDNIPYSILLTNSNDILYNNEKNEDIDFYKKDIKNIILESSTNGELHYTCPNGVEVCLNIDRVSFLEDGDSKNLVVIRDITEYKRLQKAVEYNKKKYEALVNIIPEGIYILNFENKLLTYANSTFLDMVGSRTIENIKFEDINESMVITSGSTNDNVKFKRNYVKNKYGEERYIESGGMLIDVNKRLKMIGIVRDVTEQVRTELMEREIEEKKRENKIKTEFFVNMSHELKTPLNLIYSSNQLLEVVYKDEILKNPEGELAKATGIVKKHSYMLMGLINNIMDLAKLESDFHDVNKDYYNIVDIIEDVVTEFNKYITANNIEIVFDTDKEEIISNVDPHDIEKIILTLLSAVIRYSLSSSTVYVNLNSKKNKTIISIKNIGGYDYNRYVNDLERRNLDISITVAKLIINLYDGSIDIKSSSKDNVDITVDIRVDDNITNYRKRIKTGNEDSIYAEYTRMCNF